MQFGNLSIDLHGGGFKGFGRREREVRVSPSLASVVSPLLDSSLTSESVGPVVSMVIGALDSFQYCQCRDSPAFPAGSG